MFGGARGAGGSIVVLVTGLILSGCAGQPTGPATTAPPVASATTPSPTRLPVESATASPSVPTSTPTPEPEPSSAPPPGPQTRTLRVGQTAQLRHFDVTVLHLEPTDQLDTYVELQVCYTQAHPGANSDGTTRVSLNPWHVTVSLPEEGGPPVRVPLADFVDTPPNEGPRTPAYTETLLRVGQCQRGWVGFGPQGHPVFERIHYEPRDFGDKITWILR
ncbi:hypothetical protein [Granulicoccus phenolivorans]|uniref:hypothetical protein n=1 Tax=Granulicoccus phenolivorans TaxID=266854 RepID=UPI000419348B|nr:hypothetical protein [Granulicoccus phenolivorans]